MIADSAIGSSARQGGLEPSDLLLWIFLTLPIAPRRLPAKRTASRVSLYIPIVSKTFSYCNSNYWLL